ncbi:type IX secretion system ring subunit PorN/GldN [Marinilabilia salmonicolor]|uniref:type IX secretion system ring protein PorN/GldN n=1 Tax=Marinilabilia salmonicolor TaxID=989 RepID=UPI000497BE46|nr:gliding motility protein GldN [Marinilabilia salmonicolor]
MRKQLLIMFLIGAFGFGSLNLSAQRNDDNLPIDGLFEKQHVVNRKPVPYPSIREADILWAKKIWRIIDLREKMNLPLYYPTTPMDDRYSLIDLMLKGVVGEVGDGVLGDITAFSAFSEDEFKVPLESEDDILKNLGAGTRTVMIEQEDGTMAEQTVVEGAKTYEVKQIMVKEIWYFDRNYSRLDVRILGLCPIRESVNEDLGEAAGAAGGVVKNKAFWVYFPEIRDLFAQYEVFNPMNDAQRRSFDDIFIKRYFGSYVVQEANVFDNRTIESYTVGKEAVLESKRIENEIFQWEHDLWKF